MDTNFAVHTDASFWHHSSNDNDKRSDITIVKYKWVREVDVEMMRFIMKRLPSSPRLPL